MGCGEDHYTAWKAISTVRVCHPTLNPNHLSKILKTTPSITYWPGESKIHRGESKSAGYWCAEKRVDYPIRPDSVIRWTESFVSNRESIFYELLSEGYDVNVYIAVFSDILALGFDLPPTPTLWKLGIPIGIEFFAS